MGAEKHLAGRVRRDTLQKAGDYMSNVKNVKKVTKWRMELLLPDGMHTGTAADISTLKKNCDSIVGSPCTYEDQGDGVTLVFNDKVVTKIQGGKPGYPLGWIGSTEVPEAFGVAEILNRTYQVDSKERAA